jgi:hypothetical protein
MLAKRVGMMYSTTMTNEQTRIQIDGKSYPVGNKYGVPQVKTDGGLSKTRLKEYRDCTIRALALTASIEYSVAHKIGKDAGRQRRRGFHCQTLLDQAQKSGILFSRIIGRGKDLNLVSAPVTIGEFIKNHPTGKFYCRRSGHAFAVVDGIILDNIRNTPRQRITDAWEFIPSAKDSSCQTALDNVI